MKILITLLLIILSFNLLALRKGNGGLGVDFNVPKGLSDRTFLTLEIAENIESFYDFYHFESRQNLDSDSIAQKYFPHYTHNLLDKKIGPYVEEALKSGIKAFYQVNILNNIDLLYDFLPESKVLEIQEYAQHIFNSDDIDIYTESLIPENITEDQGKINLNLDILYMFGLQECKLVQLARTINKDNSKFPKLEIYSASFLYLDELNFKTILAHEVINAVLKDAELTRKIVIKFVPLI